MLVRRAIATCLPSASQRCASSAWHQRVPTVWQRYTSISSQVEEVTQRDKRARRGREWLPADVDKLSTALAQGKSYVECARLFPDRSYDTVLKKSQRLTETYPKSPRSEEVKKVVELVRQGLSNHQIKHAMPELSLHRINQIAWLYGFAFPRQSAGRGALWSSDEDDIVLRGFAEGTKAETLAAQLPRRSTTAIEERLSVARRCGAQMKIRPSTRRPFTDEEDAILTTALDSDNLTAAEIAEKLARSTRSVEWRIRTRRAERKRQEEATKTEREE